MGLRAVAAVGQHRCPHERFGPDDLGPSNLAEPHRWAVKVSRADTRTSGRFSFDSGQCSRTKRPRCPKKKLGPKVQRISAWANIAAVSTASSILLSGTNCSSCLTISGGRSTVARIRPDPCRRVRSGVSGSSQASPRGVLLDPTLPRQRRSTRGE